MVARHNTVCQVCQDRTNAAYSVKIGHTQFDAITRVHTQCRPRQFYLLVFAAMPACP